MKYFALHPEPGVFGFGIKEQWAIILERRPPIWWLPRMFDKPDKKNPDKLKMWTCGWLLFAVHFLRRIDKG